MGKIDIFKEDVRIGDRVVIYRNFGNEDIEGVVSEIGDFFVVLLKDNNRKARIFEDIISGWDILTAIDESTEQCKQHEGVNQSLPESSHTSAAIENNSISEVDKESNIVTDKLEIQAEVNNPVLEQAGDLTLQRDSKADEKEEDSQKFGLKIVGKIDLSKCGDTKFRTKDNLKSIPTENVDIPIDSSTNLKQTDCFRTTEEMSAINNLVETESQEDFQHFSRQEAEYSPIDDADTTKASILNQLSALNSTFHIDIDGIISILDRIALNYIDADKPIKSNAVLVGVKKNFCVVVKEDGVELKCYYSRVADYGLIHLLRKYQAGDTIPILANTYIQKNTGKEIVTAICGIQSPQEYISRLIDMIDDGNFVFAKLLFEILKYNSILNKASLNKTSKSGLEYITREIKEVNFSQLDLPMINIDLKVTTDSSEKGLFKQVEQQVKRFVDVGDTGSAVQIIDKTIEDGSMSSKYISNLMLRKAQLYSSVDDIYNAQSAYSDLISYNESIGASKNNLSHLYTELARLLLQSPDTQSEALENLDKAIQLNPSNKVAAGLKTQITTKVEEDGKPTGEGIVIDASSDSSVLSKMIDIDIQEHRFTDKEILERNNDATPEIALRLYEEATKSTDPEQYPKYLEAAKAFSILKVGSYNLQNYLYVIANYSRLKGNYLCNMVKRLAQNANNESQDILNIRRLKDSAQSYFLETLDLWSSISEDSFDIGNDSTNSEASKDEILGVVLEVLANYLKLDVAHYYLDNWIACDYNSIFSSNFSQIFNQCIKSKNPELEKIAYRTVIQIGSYSVQVWNKLSRMKEGTGSMYDKFNHANTRAHIYELINNILGVQIDTTLPAGQFLKKGFALHIESRSIFEAKSASLQSEVLGPHNIAEITEKWESLSAYWSLLSETEKETKDKISEVLSVLKPYLSRKDAERTNLLIKAQSIIDTQIQFINDNTTYYGRTFFFPLLNKWKKELKNILDERIALTYPVLDVKGDPMYILNDNGKRILNLVVTNSGESSADGFELTLTLSSTSTHEDLSLSVSYKEKEIPACDRTAVKIDLTDNEIVKDAIVNVKASIAAYYLSNLLTALEYDFSVESKEEEFALTESDILWSDTRTPEAQMFVGRKEILDRLIRHYSSIERHEPYILYGLTRTGKSSILRYLGENINGKAFKARDGKEYNIIPIFIDFSQGASLGKASDFWSYVINECVFPQLDEFSISYDLFKCNDVNPRAKDFKLLLGDLKVIGLYPLFLIDEFSYIRTLIDKDIVTPAFLHSLRQYSLEGEASFIYAGTYDIKSLIKDAKYGFTGALVTAHDEEIGKIDAESADELMDAMHDSIVFTDDAKDRIHELSGDIPYFIQIICKNLGFFAVENKRKFIGYPELEKIINILTGKDPQDKASLVRELPENRFQNNQYSPLDPPEVNVLISSIVYKNRGLKIPRGVSYAELQDMWGSHGINDFRPKLASAIGLLIEKKVLVGYQDDGLEVYRLSVDLFRLWWENHHKDINRELSTIM